MRRKTIILQDKLDNAEVNYNGKLLIGKTAVVTSPCCTTPFAFRVLFGSDSFRGIIQQSEHARTVIIDQRKKCIALFRATLHRGVRLLCLSTTCEMRSPHACAAHRGSYRPISPLCNSFPTLFSFPKQSSDAITFVEHMQYRNERKWNT